MIRILRWFCYRIGWLFFFLVFTVLWRRKVVGAEHVPPKGGAIIAANHMSNADPPMVGSSILRQVYFIAKEELFRMPVVGTIIRMVNGIPISRGRQDIKAFRAVLTQLDKGHIVLMFPEGHRNTGNEFLKPKAGVGLLAQVAKVPVIPALVLNTHVLSRFKKIGVVFGKPLFFDSSLGLGEGRTKQYREFAEQIMKEIGSLRRQYL